jgi:1-acyl-sn-glycerol-3-phosphate acyltransferase
VVPFLKFFIKQELIWVPILGLAWWGLEFPFMKRYSAQFLEKHPELRGKDLETTAAMCKRLGDQPISIMNFLEGTRFGRRQNAPYRHFYAEPAASPSCSERSRHISTACST